MENKILQILVLILDLLIFLVLIAPWLGSLFYFINNF